jgi:hypothetical protein
VFFSLGFFFLQNKILPLRARCLFLLLLSFSSFFIVFSLGALLRGVARGKKKSARKTESGGGRKKKHSSFLFKKKSKTALLSFQKTKKYFFPH